MDTGTLANKHVFADAVEHAADNFDPATILEIAAPIIFKLKRAISDTGLGIHANARNLITGIESAYEMGQGSFASLSSGKKVFYLVNLSNFMEYITSDSEEISEYLAYQGVLDDLDTVRDIIDHAISYSAYAYSVDVEEIWRGELSSPDAEDHFIPRLSLKFALAACGFIAGQEASHTAKQGKGRDRSIAAIKGLYSKQRNKLENAYLDDGHKDALPPEKVLNGFKELREFFSSRKEKVSQNKNTGWENVRQLLQSAETFCRSYVTDRNLSVTEQSTQSTSTNVFQAPVVKLDDARPLLRQQLT